MGEGAQFHGNISNNEPLTRDREMQLFLIGYVIISICEIFTIGGFPLNNSVRLVRRLFQSMSTKSLSLLSCRHSLLFTSLRSLQQPGF